MVKNIFIIVFMRFYIDDNKMFIKTLNEERKRAKW